MNNKIHQIPITMRSTVLITDASRTGDIQQQNVFVFYKERLTVAELIKGRVSQEVEAFNQLKPNHFNGLVQPFLSKRNRNTNTLPNRLDFERQYTIALQAFQNNGLAILVNEEPITKLDEEIHLNYDTEISFMKYVQLVER